MANSLEGGNEASPLLVHRENTGGLFNQERQLPEATFNPKLFLPVALLAALAMASTASTSYYTYALLLCRDPAHCKGNESRRFSNTVAITTATSNVLGMLALGYLQKLSMVNNKRGLLLWMVTRAMSAVMLLVGVSTKSIYVALSGRIFEGCASDNLLHYILNTSYSRSKDQKRTSSLIGYSMAFYLAGISVSPFVAGLFKNFTVSFFIALGLFAFTIAYLQIIVPSQTSHFHKSGVSTGFLGRIAGTIMAPLQILRTHPASLLVGFALMAYNVVQSYTFGALLVHTSINFHFTGRENGFLLSIAHSVAAFYIFLSLYIIPKVIKWYFPGDMNLTPDTEQGTGISRRDTVLALVSQLIQIVSLVGIGFATTAAQIYMLTALLALSLPVPSFIKAVFVAYFNGEEKAKGLASLAVFETLGSVLGPVVLGGWQSYWVAGSTVFFVAAGIASVSVASFSVGILAIGALKRNEEIDTT